MFIITNQNIARFLVDIFIAKRETHRADETRIRENKKKIKRFP